MTQNYRTREYDKYGKPMYNSFVISQTFFSQEIEEHKHMGDSIRTSKDGQVTVNHKAGGYTTYRPSNSDV
tara:strand:+ start:1859 stop:2068 length:210 start_codon:yes stop_codon:yes gene_type:complete